MRPNIQTVIPLQAAATITTAAIPVEFVFQASAQIVATSGNSGAGGTLKMQASNDNPQTGTPIHWSDIASATVTISAAGSSLIPKTDICYEYIRLIYTNTGDGTIQVNLKTLGD